MRIYTQLPDNQLKTENHKLKTKKNLHPNGAEVSNLPTINYSGICVWIQFRNT
jgi:hypothetical protein